jgi:hypothetical protein
VKRHLAADPGESVVDLIKETLRSRDSDVNPVCRGRGFSAQSKGEPKKDDEAE